MAGIRLGRIFFLHIALIMCMHPGGALARGSSPPTLSISAGFSGHFRSGCFMPITVTLETGDQPVRGSLLVRCDTMNIRRPVDLPAPSVRTFTFLLAPHSLQPAVAARLVCNGKSVAVAKARTLEAVASPAILVALAGGAPLRFDALRKGLPKGSRIGRVAADDLPDDFRAYEALDLLIIEDLTSELNTRSREAITNWLRTGGRLLVSMPAEGAVATNAFWRTFLPQDKVAEVLADKDGGKLTHFPVGLGMVVISSYGQGPKTATDKAREEVAHAILRTLGLHPPPARPREGLVAAGVYELFEEPGWPAPIVRTVALAALGYALVMAIALKVLSREKRAVFALGTVGFAAAFTAIIHFAILPRSATTVQSASVAQTHTHSSAIAVTCYTHFTSPADLNTEARFLAPAKPVFFSDTMLARGAVDVRQLDGSWLMDIHMGVGKPTCFEQTFVSRFNGSIDVREVDGRYEIINTATGIATNRPIALTDLILTDCRDAVLIDALPRGKAVWVGFAPESSMPLSRAIHDVPAAHPHRRRMLRRWLAEHPPGSGMYLLGWSRLQPPVGVVGRFISEEKHDTLWEIKISK
jgi:hypothetical protein